MMCVVLAVLFVRFALGSILVGRPDANKSEALQSGRLPRGTKRPGLEQKRCSRGGNGRSWACCVPRGTRWVF